MNFDNNVDLSGVPPHFFEESLVSKLFNFWHPICQKTVNGVVYKVTEGFIRWEEKQKTYILYKDENMIGTFFSVDGAKKYVDNSF